jgi:flavin-binding protein dodecin
MSVYKIVDVVGTSGESISDAVRAAMERAGETLRDLGWFEVKEIRGRVAENGVGEFQVHVKLGFRIESQGDGERGSASKRRASRAPVRA